MIVKEININSEVLYINNDIITIAKVGGAFTLIVVTFITNIAVPYYTRFRTARFYIISEAISKGIIIYKYNYILSGFNWY